MLKVVVMVVTAVGAVGAVGCTKRNPAVCCLTASECSDVGLPFPSECDRGFVCEARSCIEPLCSAPSDCTDPSLAECVDGICRACDPNGNIGCGANQPRCDDGGLSCSGCMSNADCSAHPNTPFCATDGRCIQCTDDSMCIGTTPVCDVGACRACLADSECTSGACASDGGCVPVDEVIHMAPQGVATGTCSKQMPCSSFQQALKQLDTTRTHIVLRPGAYDGVFGSVRSLPNVVDKTAVIHGGDATIVTNRQPAPDVWTWIYASNSKIEIRDLNIAQPSGQYGGSAVLLQCTSAGSVTLERVKSVVPYRALVNSGCTFAITDSTLEENFSNENTVISNNTGSLEIRRSRITGVLQSPAGFAIENSLIQGPVELGVAGVFAYNTVTNVTLSSSYPYAVQCTSPSARADLKSNIIWVDGATQMLVATCLTHNNLIGPVAQGGDNISNNPMFADAATLDFHLAPTSPAIDRSTTPAPAMDFDGDLRPQGAAPDLGYDERVP